MNCLRQRDSEVQKTVIYLRSTISFSCIGITVKGIIMLRKGESSTRVVTKFYLFYTIDDADTGVSNELDDFFYGVDTIDDYLFGDVVVRQAKIDGMYFLDDKGLKFFKSMEGRYAFFRVLMMWEGVMGSGINTVDLSRGEDASPPNVKTIRSVAQVLPRPIRWWWSLYTRRLARRGMLQ